MAKRSGVNKSKAIRDALKAHRGKTPTQIAEILRGDGVDVTSAYVSNVKFHSRHRRPRTATVTGAARRTRRGRPAGANSFAAIPAAMEFVKAAGSLKAAKAALETIEEIGNVVR